MTLVQLQVCDFRRLHLATQDRGSQLRGAMLEVPRAITYSVPLERRIVFCQHETL